MSETQSTYFRREHRIKTKVKVRFSVNGGAPQLSDTLNFTLRSLAIRSDVKVAKGDKILALIERLPPLQGEVVRVFDEGFAMGFDEMSLAHFAHITPQDPRAPRAVAQMAGAAPGRLVSPIFRLSGPRPAWARIATSPPRKTGLVSHYLSIIAEEDAIIDDIRSVWVSVDQSRWLARVQDASKRGAQSIVVLALNDWQLRLASIAGMRIDFFGGGPDEETFIVSPKIIRRHLQSVKTAGNARASDAAVKAPAASQIAPISALNA